MKRLSIISGVLFLCTSLMAANKITGKIIDESNNQHIGYANVSLLTQDSTFITGVATDNGGGFLLKEVNDGDYILCISCVGYENSYLSIRNLQANLNLGELPLSPDNVMLEGVTVTASPIIKKTRPANYPPRPRMQTKAASNGGFLTEKSTTVAHPDQSDRQQHHDSGGDNVQLRINGVEVTQPEIIAIPPDRCDPQSNI
ncbi:MAG: carboxypeptidase-like regulatory domain-containing protein [Bacteroides cellulosilyticus]